MSYPMLAMTHMSYYPQQNWACICTGRHIHELSHAWSARRRRLRGCLCISAQMCRGLGKCGHSIHNLTNRHVHKLRAALLGSVMRFLLVCRGCKAIYCTSAHVHCRELQVVMQVQVMPTIAYTTNRHACTLSSMFMGPCKHDRHAVDGCDTAYDRGISTCVLSGHVKPTGMVT
jgi:hypothetical protein